MTAMPIALDECWAKPDFPIAESEGWHYRGREKFAEVVTQLSIRCRPMSLAEMVRELSSEPWFMSVFNRLHKFTALEENWDGYGGHRINSAAIMETFRTLYRVARGGPKPFVVPVNDGGIQIEWYCGDTEIEVEISASGRVLISIEQIEGVSVERYVSGVGDSLWDLLQQTVFDLQANDIE